MEQSSYRFSQTLWKQYHSGKIAVIPDIKPRSPQCGDLLRGRDPVSLALALVQAGAPALSVVTEKRYFGGSPGMLAQVFEATGIPILRKDFISHPAQLEESKALGASAVLLIAATLSRQLLFELVGECFRLGLEPLVETHCQEEIQSMQGLALTMMGINNRSIVELEMDEGSVQTTEELARLTAPGVLLISESAISSRYDVERASAAGAHSVLVGTAILQAGDAADQYTALSGVRPIQP